MSYDSGSNYKYPEQNKKPSAEEMLPIASTSLQTEIKDNKEYEKYCKQLETDLEQLRGEKDSLQKTHDELFRMHVETKVYATLLQGDNEKYRQALESIRDYSHSSEDITMAHYCRMTAKQALNK